MQSEGYKFTVIRADKTGIDIRNQMYTENIIGK